MSARRGAPADPSSIAGRIRAAILADPLAKNSAIAAAMGVTPLYVIQVRRRMKLAELASEGQRKT